MLIVNALAGTGKTTTGMWGLGNRVPKDVNPSDEQKAIVKAMRAQKGQRMGAMAFNKSIAVELESRVPAGVQAGTANSFGHRAWSKFLGKKRLKVDGLKTRRLCRELLEKRYDFKERQRIEAAVNQYVRLAKCYLFDISATEKTNVLSLSEIEGEGQARTEMADGNRAMLWLAERFDIDKDPVVLEWAVATFKASLEHREYIDFDDQIFFPVWEGIELPKFDHLLVDELQDLNKAKQELAFRMADDITGIGDVHQAIYGFSGADSDAMANVWTRMQEIDANAQSLPLTITRRCPFSVVAEANRYVPELRAAEGAPEGIIDSIQEHHFLEDTVTSEGSRMILCRVNAPLTSLAFKIIARGRRAFIQGRDIGAGLKQEIKKVDHDSLPLCVANAVDRIDTKILEIKARSFPDDAKIEALEDRKACVEVLAEGCQTKDDYYDKVDSMFKDSGAPGDIRLSSVHKAKGLEHEHVCIYKPSKLPHPRLMKGFQRQQEFNLAYVAITRSMNRLTTVQESDEVPSESSAVAEASAKF